jgi:hypothetical protein
VPACCHHKNRFAAALTLGLGLIVLGVVHGLQALDYLDLKGLLFFWPTALLVLALGAVALQLKDMGYRDLLHQGWPVGLIWLGVVQVLRSLFRRHRVLPSVRCENASEDGHES